MTGVHVWFSGAEFRAASRSVASAGLIAGASILVAATAFGVSVAAEAAQTAQAPAAQSPSVQADPGSSGPAPGNAPPTAAEAAAQAAAQAVAEAAARRKAEIATAKARCVALMARHDLVVIPRDAIEEGECGTLAPVELVAVGKSPQVALSPPAIVTCEMAVAIHDWVKSDIQPLAKKHLGQPIARIETMSSYSCRNAFNRKGGKLSEHGKANAIDIRGFVTAKGETAYVLENWGPTALEVAAMAAKADAERKARELADAKAQAEAAANAQAVAAAKSGAEASKSSSNPLAAAGTLIDGLPKAGITIGGGGLVTGGQRPTDFGIAPSRLGGPKPAVERAIVAAPVAAPANPTKPATPPGAISRDARSAFLRDVHAAACQRFMTTLGPEADKWHRNHYHVDLAERRTAKRICD